MTRNEPNVASKLRSRITIEQPVDTPDGSGGISRSWQEVAVLWAEILPLRGSERLRAMQLTSNVSHRFRIRFKTGITSAMRISWNSKIFNIQAVLDTRPQSGMLELLAEEEALES